MQNLTRTLAAAALVLGATTAASAQTKAPDFSGQWEMNTAKSDFGPVPAPTKASMTVEQSAAHLKFTQTVATPAGDRTMAQDIPLTVADSTYNGPDGQPLTSSTKVDNGALVVNVKLNRQGADITQTARWTLSPDGKMLTLDQQMASPMGALAFKIVFDKK